MLTATNAPRRFGDAGDGRLADLAAKLGWTAARGEAGSGAGVLPPKAVGAGDGWLAVQNARYAVEPAEGLLRRLKATGGDVVCVRVTRGESAYKERLRVTGDGTVVGFRRLYHDTTAPAPIPADWPHIVLLSRKAAAAIGRDVPGEFATLIERAKAAGLAISSFDAGGTAWDMASPDGLLGYYARRVSPMRTASAGGPGKSEGVAATARLVGDVVVERGARVGENAVVVGPAFIGEGAVVEADAFVSGSIIAPGAIVRGGRSVRNSVIVPDRRDGAERTAVGACAPRDGGVGNNYRQWPLFSYARLGKRAFDVIFSLCAFVVLATVFPLVAAAIKLTSRGPVFYGHRRQGLRGKTFRCLKFRTMIVDAESVKQDLMAINEVDGPQFKIEDDPRVTIVGAFLRATNLDEIPQFINVLKGDMSIVGPRPSPDEENQMCPAWREARLSVRPGITGLWQVMRSAERTNDFHEWIHYDVQYVRRLSPLLDLKITAKTVLVLAGAVTKLFVTRGSARDAGK